MNSKITKQLDDNFVPIEPKMSAIQQEKHILTTYLNAQSWYIRLTHKEYWYLNILFIPLTFYRAYLALKAHSFFFFSAANPALPTGGWMGYSKASIHQFTPPQYRPKTIVFKQGNNMQDIQTAMTKAQLDFPVVLKPVVGCRGRMVKKVESLDELWNHTQWYNTDFLIEEYINYPVEATVLYFKKPETGESGILSVALKNFLTVVGDGERTIMELLMDNPIGVLQVKRFESEKSLLMLSIPQNGKKIVVEPIGNLCRGTQFVDGRSLITSKMVAAYDKIHAGLEGYYIYSLDLKTPSIADLQAGQNLKILSIRGVGADPAHVFDTCTSFKEMFLAYVRFWDKVYEISTASHRQGVQYIGYRAFKHYVSQQKRVNKLVQHDNLLQSI
jgi:hypothetical protein